MQKHCISVEDVYGTAAPEVPQGYELTGEFRPAKTGETVLLTNGQGAHKMFGDSSAMHPRLILKKLTTVEDTYGAPLEKLTPPIGYRFTGEFRKPTAEDVCLLPGSPFEAGHMVQYEWIRSEDMEQLEPRLILKKLPPTPTIKDVYGTDNPPIPAGWKFKEFRQVDNAEKIHVLGAAHSANPLTANYLPSFYIRPDRWRIVLEQDLSQFTYPMPPENIYGSMPSVPAGYEVVGFRPPREDELYLSIIGGVGVAFGSHISPRLILSPLGPR